LHSVLAQYLLLEVLDVFGLGLVKEQSVIPTSSSPPHYATRAHAHVGMISWSVDWKCDMLGASNNMRDLHFTQIAITI
jgi:hypothetical protein